MSLLSSASPSRPTARELEVLQQAAWGISNKEIAARLQLSVKTIESHKQNGMRKLGLDSRAAIVRHAVLEGWLSKETLLGQPMNSAR